VNRLDSVIICAVAAVALLVCGLFIPAHLRAVDERVIERAGRNTPTLLDRGAEFVRDGNFGAARLIAATAREEKIPNAARLDSAIATNAKKESRDTSIPITEFVIRSENSEKILAALQKSSDRTTQELLKLRALTNTVVFPPSPSASGQAIDAAIAICGTLADEHDLSASLSGSILNFASQANRGASTQPIEDVLLDVMSLGQRFSRGQLIAFVKPVNDTTTLHLLATDVRNFETQLPALFSAEQISGNPSAVAKFLGTWTQTGIADLKTAVRFGEGSVNELLNRNQRICVSKFPALFPGLCLRAPELALALKWFFYVCGGFLFALTLHFARRVPRLEQPLQVRGFHFAREFLFSLGFLLVVLLVSEPFLAQESQKTEVRFQLRLPTAGGVVPFAPGGNSIKSFMNHEVLLTMLLFFVLQVLLYVACVLKLAEIRRQRITSRMKLKLLENEDHLFDAGLYLGFFGTIVSLILVSLGVFKQPSLMAAYSSTSFGILFVSFFKIVHLRPARRKLLLEADAAPREEVAPGQTYAVS
jgi:hypothetical protein